MKTFKRILLVIAVLVLVAQIPFAINRYRTSLLATKIQELSGSRKAVPGPQFRDFKGVIHVHSFLGGHSTGTFDELIDGARKNGLDFVVMTEHVSDDFDTAAKTLNERHGRTVWIGGNEASASDGDRFLVVPGFDGVAALQKVGTNEFIKNAEEHESLALVAYPEKFHSWNADISGIEIFSLNTNAKKMNPVMFIMDAIWSYSAYPELTLARYFKRPDENLARYDGIAANRRLLLFGGNDAHSNIGLFLGDDANNKIVNLKYDRYATIFSLMRTHILVRESGPLTRKEALGALAGGNSYIGFDVLGDPTGFSFYAVDDSGIAIMGEATPPGSSPRLHVTSPLPARFVIFRDGKKVFESKEGFAAETEASGPGAYRVEAYLDSLGAPFNKMPWVISNPIYVGRAEAAAKPTDEKGDTSQLGN